MRRGREIEHLQVVDLARGVKVGTVGDLVIDVESRSVAALLLNEAGPDGRPRLVPFESIRRVGPDAVTIEDESVVVAAQEHQSLRSLYESPVKVVGTKVLTEEGRLVGSVSDVVVDEPTGAIKEFEVSAGVVQDLLAGRIYVSAIECRAIGDDYMVVPETAAARGTVEEAREVVLEAPARPGGEVSPLPLEMVAVDERAWQEEWIVGLRAHKNVTDEDAGGVLVYEGETISRGTVQAVKAAGKLNELIHAAGEAAALAFSEGTTARYARSLVGRMAGRTVHTPEGEVVVAQGDAITPEVVRRAWEAGVMDQLVESVAGATQGSGEPRAARRRAVRSLWDQVSERVGWLTGRR